MSEPRIEINELELLSVKVKSNNKISEHRKSIGLETPKNRIDQGDLKQIIFALSESGFDIVRRLK